MTRFIDHGRGYVEAVIVVITGASSGIGRETAVACTRRGHAVVLAGRNRADLMETARLCSDRADVDIAVMDVTDPDAVAGLIERAVHLHGRVDAVVHAAAVLAYGKFEEMPAEVFDATLDINIRGTVHVARSALEQFRRQDAGHLVLLGSLLGDVPAPLLIPYVVSKWAVHGLARSLQLELRGTPRRVTLVAPAGIRTPIYDVAANFVGRHGRPPPPVYDPESAAEAIVQVLHRPRRKKRVGALVNLLAAGASRLVPGVYDPVMVRYIRFGGLTRQPVVPTDGNLFHSLPHTRGSDPA